jgi:hypothetical protein
MRWSAPSSFLLYGGVTEPGTPLEQGTYFRNRFFYLPAPVPGQSNFIWRRRACRRAISSKALNRSNPAASPL